MAVIIVVTFGIKFRFTASLLSTLGKKYLVIAPPIGFTIFLFLSIYTFFKVLFVNLMCVT